MKKVLIEIVIITVAAVFFGFASNALNPNGVKIINERPVKEAAADTVFSDEPEPSAAAVVINKQQLKALIKSGAIVILDVRGPEEFAEARIPNAVNVPFELLGEFIETVDALDKAVWTITYCDGPPCDKAQLLARELVDMGFERTAWYDAGLNDWRKTEDVDS